MAELLIKAKSHHMDSLNQTEINQLSDTMKDQYNARSQIGDIIAVHPNGWNWGKKECLPNYIVIKIPKLSFEEAKKYREPIIGERNDAVLGIEQYETKHRKYQIPQSVVNDVKQAFSNSIIINSSQKNAFLADIIDKSK